MDGSYALRASIAGCALLLRAHDAQEAEREQREAEGSGRPSAAHDAQQPHSPDVLHAGTLRSDGGEADEASSSVGEVPAGHSGAEATPATEELDSSSSGDAQEQHRNSRVRGEGRKSKARKKVPPEPGSPAGLCAAAVKVRRGWDDSTSLNLWLTQYSEDPRPISSTCGCFACARHSRAYVHHLLQTREILGQVGRVSRLHAGIAHMPCMGPLSTVAHGMCQVLLEIHNTLNLSEFFDEARQAICEGNFEEYRAAFTEKRFRNEMQMQRRPLPGLELSSTLVNSAKTRS